MSTSENKKTKKSCKILSQECIGTDIYSMWLDAREIGKNAVPGQFVSLYSRNGSKLLPRPISLCEIDKEEGKLRLVYRVTGKGTGTEEFSRLHAGVPVETLGPLGNGFPLDAVPEQREMSWMLSVRMALRQMRSLPVDRRQCSVPSRHMPLKREFPAGFPWKSVWPVV